MSVALRAFVDPASWSVKSEKVLGVQGCPTPEAIDGAAAALKQVGEQLGLPREEGVVGFDKEKDWNAAVGLASTCAHPPKPLVPFQVASALYGGLHLSSCRIFRCGSSLQ